MAADFFEHGSGIILRTIRVGEADIRAEVFMQGQGLISCLIKGVRKTKSRSLAGLQIGTLAEWRLYKSKNQSTQHVKEYTPVRIINQDHRSYANFSALNYILSLFAMFARHNHEDHGLWNLINGFTQTFEDREINHEVIVFFKVRLLKLQGLLPDPFYCSQCQEKLVEIALWGAVDMGMLCHDCHQKNFNPAEKIVGYSLGLLQSAAFHKFSDFEKYGQTVKTKIGDSENSNNHFENFFHWDHKLNEIIQSQQPNSSQLKVMEEYYRSKNSDLDNYSK